MSKSASVGVAIASIAAWVSTAGTMGGELQGPRLVRAWGYNWWGESNTPADLSNVTVIAIAGGDHHTIVLHDDGSIRCWGYNEDGRCNVPTDLGAAIAVAGGWAHTIALLNDGSVRCWGFNNQGQCNVPSELGPVASIDGGGFHTIALRTDGSVRCWGSNNQGQCNVPITLGTIAKIDGGGYHTVALGSDGSVHGWGLNTQGQCSVPFDLGAAVSIAAGESHTLALRSDGSVRAWGRNDYGQCNVPVGLGEAVKIATGLFHSIALLADGSIRCWGRNDSGQCNVPADVGSSIAVSGGNHTIALWLPATLNLRDSVASPTIPRGILTASDGDTLLCAPSALGSSDIDYRGKSIELLSTNAIARNPATTTLFADGARMSAPESIALDGTINVPTNAGISLSSGDGLSIDGDTFVSLGGSILAQNDGSPVVLAGDMVLATDAVFNALAPISLTGTLDILGGVVVSENLTTSTGSHLVAVNGTVDVGSLTIGGQASSLSSAIVSNVAVAANAELAASGQVVGDVTNWGRLLTTDDLVVVGDLTNNAGGMALAQVGVLYITGDLVNHGFVFGNVITAPGFQGGGTGGTQAGDGIRVAGSVDVGPAGELRFVEELWKFSVCGDLTLACPAGSVRFNGAELAFDGCGAKDQRVEATSRDLGCHADLFEGEEDGLSLFGELSVKAGTTVRIVDDFANAPGKGGEVIYARGLSVAAGATLITDGRTIYTLNAIIEGTVDDPSNICEAPDLPSPDINGDGRVNAIDLAYVLTYWNTPTAIADLDRDGTVGATDLAIVLSAWAP